MLSPKNKKLKIQDVKNQVENLLKNDQSGHGMDHIERVLNLSLTFSTSEKVNRDVVALIALLHDVDDYKLFGIKKSTKLSNAKKIMEKSNVSQAVQSKVLEAIQTIGFHKRLKGILPTVLEAQIVSDADMCDAMGTHGLFRTYAYSMQIGHPFFDRTLFPLETLNFELYTSSRRSTGVNHLFEKILRLKDFMLTEAGKKEALLRHSIVVQFLRQFFNEENAPEWVEYLKKFIGKKAI